MINVAGKNVLLVIEYEQTKMPLDDEEAQDAPETMEMEYEVEEPDVAMLTDGTPILEEGDVQ